MSLVFAGVDLAKKLVAMHGVNDSAARSRVEFRRGCWRAILDFAEKNARIAWAVPSPGEPFAMAACAALATAPEHPCRPRVAGAGRAPVL